MGSLWSVLKAAVLAGLIAGAITAGFHTLLLEPLIERAIELEEQASQTHGQAAREPVIDRPTQRWGLVLGFLVYGALSLLPFLPGEGWDVRAKAERPDDAPCPSGRG